MGSVMRPVMELDVHGAGLGVSTHLTKSLELLSRPKF